MQQDDDVQLYERLLARNLAFYDQLRLRERRPKTAAQRQFQDVAWFKAGPVTDHEKAYVFYLKRSGRGPDRSPPPRSPGTHGIEACPAGMRPVSMETATKWAEPYTDARGSRPDWD